MKTLDDVHIQKETRNIGIELVGIENYSLPISIAFEQLYHANADFRVGVGIDEKTKGAHLSRIITVLDEFYANKIIDINTMKEVLKKLKQEVEVERVNLEMFFNIINKTITPQSKKETFINSRVGLMGNIDEKNNIIQSFYLKTTGAMLCPSSKKISQYGAHNQRAEIQVKIEGDIKNLKLLDVLYAVRNSFSAPVYGVVKREDEKFMTEQAYENPKFSEDAIRDTLLALKSLYDNCSIEAELHNYESIHQHNVYVKGKIK